MTVEYDILEYVRKNEPSSKHQIYNNIDINFDGNNTYIKNGKINIALQKLIEIGIIYVSIDGYEVSEGYDSIAS